MSSGRDSLIAAKFSASVPRRDFRRRGPGSLARRHVRRADIAITIPEFIALLKANAGKMQYGSAGAKAGPNAGW